MIAEIHTAQVMTMTMGVKVLGLEKKPATIALYNQLLVEDLISFDGTLRGWPFGWVNRHHDLARCKDLPPHWHVVFYNEDKRPRVCIVDQREDHTPQGKHFDDEYWFPADQEMAARLLEVEARDYADRNGEVVHWLRYRQHPGQEPAEGIVQKGLRVEIATIAGVRMTGCVSERLRDFAIATRDAAKSDPESESCGVYTAARESMPTDLTGSVQTQMYTAADRESERRARYTAVRKMIGELDQLFVGQA